MHEPSAPIELGFRPYPHQRAAHALLLVFRFVVLVWHRRGGKTVFAVMELILGALRCKRERGRYGYIAPQLKQAKAVVWDYLKHFTRAIPGCTYNEAELYAELPNGARIRLFGADNPDSLRGIYLDGAVLDEVAQMKRAVWGEIIRPALADRQGWVIFIGTPKGVNLFSELYQFALRGEDGWAADMKRAADTEVIPEEEIEQARRSMSPQQFAQEFECDFAASVENALIQLDLVLGAMRRTLLERDYDFAAKILGVDVARYGDDRSCIFPRQGLVAFTPKVFRNLDTMQLSGQVAMAVDSWKPDAIFVDLGAMGAGVVDRLRQLGYRAIGVDFGSRAIDPRFENKRAEMWWSMGEWVKAGPCLPDIPEIVPELTAPTYTYANARGRFELESKDDMRARGLPSPDIGDALALTFAAPVAPKATLGMGLGAPPSFLKGHDYDPYAEGRA